MSIRRFYNPPDLADRLQAWISAALQLAILAVLTGALLEGQYLVAFTASVVLLISFAPLLLDLEFDLQVPVELTLANCLFLYAAFGLGEIRGFYTRYWWWDILLHSASAIAIGLIGFLIVHLFYRTRRVNTSPTLVAVFSFGFAVSIGTLWEIFEFSLDQALGLNMQKSGLRDTMGDLIVDCLGALLASWLGYHYVKDGDSMIADRLVRRFVARNPRLFQRHKQE